MIIGLITFVFIVFVIGYLITKALEDHGYEYESNIWFGDYDDTP